MIGQFSGPRFTVIAAPNSINPYKYFNTEAVGVPYFLFYSCGIEFLFFFLSVFGVGFVCTAQKRQPVQ